MTGAREDRFDGQITPDEKTMGMLAHLLGILTGFLGPLIVWLIKKDQSKYVAEQSKEALNFWISILIYLPVTCCLAGLFGLIMGIIGTIKSNQGIIYRYPLAIRFIK
ncbi:MAG TPA: DUF4870 domain-containing protein [Phycisphaerae bacterium]|nr:DUF4870 domain-containing protein [Phycisphaerae bacterium]